MTSTTAFSIKKPLCWCWQIKIFFCRAKKNYDGMVEVNRLSRDFFTKCHVMDFEICSLINRQKMMDFEILSKTITVSEDE